MVNVSRGDPLDSDDDEPKAKGKAKKGGKAKGKDTGKKGAVRDFPPLDFSGVVTPDGVNLEAALRFLQLTPASAAFAWLLNERFCSTQMHHAELRGASLIKKRTLLGPYSRPMLMVLQRSLWGSYERGTPVHHRLALVPRSGFRLT